MVESGHDRDDERGDPLGYAEDLRTALARPALRYFAEVKESDLDHVPSDVCKAAFQVALSLGRCRLFGVEPAPGLDGTLPPRVALASMMALMDHLLRWTKRARLLAESEDRLDSLLQDDECANLLEARMIAWACFVAIDESYVACLENASLETSHFTARIDQLLDGMDAFDQALASELETLAVVADTPLLNNWRSLLATRFQEIPPWWLDGRLEEAAQLLQEKSLRIQPSQAFWERLSLAQRRLRPKKIRRSLALAADIEGNQPSVQEVFVWRSPDGQYQAVLILPEEIEERGSLAVRFLTTQDQPAYALADEMVSLLEVGSTIDAKGWAYFPWTAIETHQDREPILLVTSGQVRWILQ